MKSLRRAAMTATGILASLLVLSVSGLTAGASATDVHSGTVGANWPVRTAAVVTPVSPYVTRIHGVDAIATSIAISQAEFPTIGSASAVVLAQNDFFSDALAGGPLAAYVHGPLLLTWGASVRSTLSTRTAAEIQRVLPAGDTVYVLGGDLAISPTVDATLRRLGYRVVREAGTDEYDTAYLIALKMGSLNVIFEATGTNFYDSLSAVPAAIARHAAILLTNGATQSAPTASYIASHPGITRYAIGGPLAAYGADPGAIPVYGATLYGTSAAVASTFFPSASLVGVATSAGFADAAAGGVYMATNGRTGPLLIVNPSLPLPTEYSAYLASLLPNTTVVVFGGPLAISADVVQAVRGALG